MIRDSDLANQNQNKNQPKRTKRARISQLAKIFVKVLASLYLMTQFEGFTYMVTSIRAGPGLWDWFMIITNIVLLLITQLICFRIV